MASPIYRKACRFILQIVNRSPVISRTGCSEAQRMSPFDGRCEYCGKTIGNLSVDGL